MHLVMCRVSHEKSDVLPRTSVAATDRVFAVLSASVALVASARPCYPCLRKALRRQGGRGTDGRQSGHSKAGGKRRAHGQRETREREDATIFAPGAPPPPTVLNGAPSGEQHQPRQWAYPVGVNLAQRPRATETTTFEQLRNLAALYDGIQICERVYFDLIGRLELRVLPRADLLTSGEDANAPRWREPARRIEALLESPDRSQDLRSWLVAFVRDLLEIDAVAIYTRRTRSGALHALELVATEREKATPLCIEMKSARKPSVQELPYSRHVYII